MWFFVFLGFIIVSINAITDDEYNALLKYFNHLVRVKLDPDVSSEHKDMVFKKADLKKNCEIWGIMNPESSFIDKTEIKLCIYDENVCDIFYPFIFMIYFAMSDNNFFFNRG